MKTLIAILMLTTNLASAESGGATGVGGGGDAVILKDDQVILADPFARVEDSLESEITLAPVLKAEIGLGIAIAGQYKADASYLRSNILWKGILYYAVDKIPAHRACENRLDYAGLPEGASLSQVACTIGNRTWIREDLFKRMNLREQALLLIHEGLRRNPPELALDSDLVKVTNGLRVAYEYYQRQMKGDYSAVTSDERRALADLIRGSLARTYEYKNKERLLLKRANAYRVTDHGGLVLAIENGFQIDKDAVIGIGAVVGTHSIDVEYAHYSHYKIEKGAVLLFSNVSSDIGPRTKVIGSNVVGCYVSGDVRIENSGVHVCHIAEGAVIENSILSENLHLPNIQIGKNAKIRSVNITNTNLRERLRNLTIEADAELSGFQLKAFTWDTDMTIRGQVDGSGFACDEFAYSAWQFGRKKLLIESKQGLIDNCKK